ncbi:hypothetical protein UXN88_16945 [Enterobacter hormaechei]
MSVKRYEVNGSSSVFEDENGSLVDYEDYAALAAENAGLKQGTPDLQTMMSALDAFFADEEVPERAMLAAYNILRGAVETPATDAFLAEARALGVEMAAQSEQFSTWVQQGLRSFAIGVRQGDEFVSELRKGVQS